MAAQDETLRQELQKMSEGDDENCFTIDLNRLLESKFGNLRLCEIPAKTAIYSYDEFGNDWVFNSAGEIGYISRCKAITSDNWDYTYSVKTYGSKMIEVINSWSSDEKVVMNESDSGDEDRRNFYIWYFVKIDGKATLKEAVSYGEKIEQTLEKQTHTLLNKMK